MIYNPEYCNCTNYVCCMCREHLEKQMPIKSLPVHVSDSLSLTVLAALSKN